jgi:hypothetical protein
MASLESQTDVPLLADPSHSYKNYSAIIRLIAYWIKEGNVLKIPEQACTISIIMLIKYSLRLPANKLTRIVQKGQIRLSKIFITK